MSSNYIKFHLKFSSLQAFYVPIFSASPSRPASASTQLEPEANQSIHHKQDWLCWPTKEFIHWLYEFVWIENQCKTMKTQQMITLSHHAASPPTRSDNSRAKSIAGKGVLSQTAFHLQYPSHFPSFGICMVFVTLDRSVAQQLFRPTWDCLFTLLCFYTTLSASQSASAAWLLLHPGFPFCVQAPRCWCGDWQQRRLPHPSEWLPTWMPLWLWLGIAPPLFPKTSQTRGARVQVLHSNEDRLRGMFWEHSRRSSALVGAYLCESQPKGLWREQVSNLGSLAIALSGTRWYQHL